MSKQKDKWLFREVLGQRNTKMKMMIAFISSFIAGVVLFGGGYGYDGYLGCFCSIPICFLLGVFDHRILAQLFYAFAAAVGSIGIALLSPGGVGDSLILILYIFVINIIPMTIYGFIAGVMGICAGGIACKVIRRSRDDSGERPY